MVKSCMATAVASLRNPGRAGGERPAGSPGRTCVATKAPTMRWQVFTVTGAGLASQLDRWRAVRCNRSMRSPRLAASVLAVAVVTACAGGGSGRTSDTSPPTSSSAPAPGPSGEASPSPVRVQASAALKCDDYLDTATPDRSYQIVLGVVALPASSTSPALQTARTGDAGSTRLYAKTGLLIRAGATFQLSVPVRVAGRFAIGWGNPAVPTHGLLVAGCRPPGGEHGQWLAYAGGYFVHHVMCALLRVAAAGRTRQVRIGIGAPCPGQRPPPQPSET